MVRGRFDEAEPMIREALTLHKRLQGNKEDYASVLANLAYVLWQRRNVDEGETTYRKALAIYRELPGNHQLQIASLLRDFGILLADRGKPDEGESMLKEALAIRKQIGDPNDLSFLALVLARDGKRAEAEELFNEGLSPSADRETRLSALRARVLFATWLGDWKQAIADETALIELAPTKHMSYHWLAPLLVFDGQLDAYRKLCQQIIERFGATKDHPTANRMAKDCLILASSGVNLETVGELAETAVSLGGGDARVLPCHQFVKGLAEYRQGRFLSAVGWLEKALTRSGESLARDVEAYTVLAMAQYQLRHASEARAALAKATEIAETKLPKLGSGDISWESCNDMVDMLIAHALMCEAKGLIEGSASSPIIQSQTSNPPEWRYARGK
jgi:tetratricopeptide (TPR) repeat protein